MIGVESFQLIRGATAAQFDSETFLYGKTPEELTELKRHFPNPRDAVAYILDTFPIVKRKDEEKYDGDYRIKRVILEIYDEMAEAVHTGIPYKTHLDSPPADARCCHPSRGNKT